MARTRTWDLAEASCPLPVLFLAGATMMSDPVAGSVAQVRGSLHDVGSAKCELASEGAVGGKVNGRFDGETDRVAGVDEKLCRIARDGKRCDCSSDRVSRCGESPRPPLAGSCRSAIPMRRCRPVKSADRRLRRSSPSLQGRDESFCRDLTGGPGSGNERSGSDDVSLRLTGNGLRRRTGLLRR